MTAEHNAAAGEYCPFCHATEIDGGYIDIEAQAATQECSCIECGAEWIDHYKIDHVDIIKMPQRCKATDYVGRAPTDIEVQAITEMFEDYQPGIIVVYDHYISDGPGYAGWLAVTVGGEPQFCDAIIKDSNGQMMLASGAT